MGGANGTCGERRGACRVLLGKLEGKGQLGKHRHRWEDNIETYLSEIGGEFVDWIGLALERDNQRAFVKIVMNF